jgi:hypothetical protein
MGEEGNSPPFLSISKTLDMLMRVVKRGDDGTRF